MATAPKFAAVTKAPAQAGSVILDLSGDTFMDSNGVSTIIRLLQRVPDCRILHGVPDQVLLVLRVSGLIGIERLHVMPCDARTTHAA